MPNAIQDAILEAIDNLANDRINRLQTDKTITATIVQCNNSLTGEHQVNYQGGNFVAYAEDGTAYNKNAAVYVLVPEGNFSKRKIIVGRATALEDDSNITFVSSLMNDYNTIGRNVIKHKSNKSFSLHSYLKEDYYLIYNYEDRNNSEVDIDIEEFQNYLLEAEAIMIEASFQTRLPKEHRNSKTGMYGLQFLLAFKDRSTDQEEYRTYSYVLDANNMTGNPYAFTTWSDQYAIFPIDTENFSHIQSIMFYSYGFVDKDDHINNDLWGADIWCNQLEIYGLKHIDEQNGDYRLKISTPQGATFKSSMPDSSLEVLASFQYQMTYLTESTMFYWFVEDARVTSSSPDYQMYGGTGWRRLKDKGTGATIKLYETDNKAFENRYLCVAVYKEQIILKSYFTIYNDAAKRDIEIISDLGLKFSFDRGKPLLTCYINSKEDNFEKGVAPERPDSYYTFLWSKIDEYGQVYPLNRTYEELKAEYDEGLYNGIGYAALSNIKNNMALMDGVEFPKGMEGNKLYYPIKAIDNYGIFKCSVFLKDGNDKDSYFIGSAQITLQNEGAATPNDYFILIENGDQVFQYSESGVSPTNERYADPLVIPPLYCHFYDPAGLEINSSTYNVKWQVPISDTMIKIPKLENLTWNPATDKPEWFTEEIYPMDIVDNFDYQALNNQITCIVTYQNQTYTRDTRFSFVKVGDNGTNGTDVVAKISAKSNAAILDHDMLTLEYDINNVAQWNTGQRFTDDVLQFDLYQRGQKLSITSAVRWSIAGTSSIAIGVDGDVVGARITEPTNQYAKLRNQIVKAETTLRDTAKDNSTIHYAFYQIPIVKYYKTGYKVHIDTDYTLKQILYNADGRNPLYNKNQGVKLRIEHAGRDISSEVITLDCIGGVNGEATGNNSNAAFKIIEEKNSKDGKFSTTLGTDDNGEIMFYILPDDVYSGMYTNNIIWGRIYSDRTQIGNNPEVEFWIPIHMQLNTYGLASLNAWDGNSIQINDDGKDGYILAPQIGAGEKNEKNQFTGIVMGKVETYDQTLQKKWTNGLLGYHEGQQSIFLDAVTGNATFGLSSDESDSNNPQNEGRIELRPGGTSRISRWRFDKNSLYNAQLNGVEVDMVNKYTDLRNTSTRTYHHSIPHWAEGILLSADPSYISIKGQRMLEDSGINFGHANTVIVEGDAFEVQLNPNDTSLFTIYRHTNTVSDRDFRLMGGQGITKKYLGKLNTNNKYAEAQYKGTNYEDDSAITGWKILRDKNGNQVDGGTFILPERSGEIGWALREVKGNYLNKIIPITNRLKPEEGVWHREEKVGINAQGRFYSNALRDSSTAMNIGPVGAFGLNADAEAYTGASFEIGHDVNNTNVLIKMFTDTDLISSKTGPLYISGGTETGTEYPRPISMHGASISLYARNTSSATGNSIAKTTDNKLEITQTQVLLQKANSYLQLQSSTMGDSQLQITGDFTKNISRNETVKVSGTTVDHSYCNSSVNTGKYNQRVYGTVNKEWTGTDIHKIIMKGNLDIKVKDTWQITTGSTASSSGTDVMRIGSQTGSSLGISSSGTANLISSKSAFIELQQNGLCTLGCNGGWHITSNSASAIASGGNITIVTSSGGSTTFLSLTPQGGGGGMFNLNTANGRVTSVGSAESEAVGPIYNSGGSSKTSYTGVNIMKGMQTNYINIRGKITETQYPKYALNTIRPIIVEGDGENRFLGSIYVKGNAKDDKCYIKCDNNFIAGNDYKWTAKKSYNYTIGSDNGPASYDYLGGHLQKIYSLFQKVLTEVSNNYATKTDLESVKAIANEAKTAVANKLDASTFNSHTHSYEKFVNILSGKKGYLVNSSNTYMSDTYGTTVINGENVSLTTGTPN